MIGGAARPSRAPVRAAAAFVAAALLLAGCAGGDAGTVTPPAAGGDPSKDAFLADASKACERFFYDRAEARDDVRAFTARFNQDLDDFDWSYASLRRLVRDYRGWRRAVQDHLRVWKAQLIALYSIDTPTGDRREIDEILTRYTDAWVELRTASKHRLLFDDENYERSWLRLMRAVSQANALAERYGLAGNCASAWELGSLRVRKLV